MAMWDNWLFVVSKEFHGTAYSILTDDEQKSKADEYRAAGYDVLTAAEFDDLMDRWERSMCGDWKEITEEEYDDALNILPPVKWCGGGFFSCEAFSGTLHSFYQRMDGRYYTSLQSICEKRENILASLMKFLGDPVSVFPSP